jgi:hypothetical protein
MAHNLFDQQLVVSRGTDMVWKIETVDTVQKVDERYRLLHLNNGNIVWLTKVSVGVFKVWAIEAVEPYVQPDDPHKGKAHAHDFSSGWADIDANGRIFLYCLCGHHITAYPLGINLTEHKKAVKPGRFRSPAPDSPAFPKTVFVFSDLDFKCGAWMVVDVRPDGLYQGYVDVPTSSLLEKFVVRQDSGRWVINHPMSVREGKLSRLNMPVRSDYLDAKPQPVVSEPEVEYDEDGEPIEEI